MAKRKHYVYAVMDGPVVLYVGKGTGRRMAVSAKGHGGAPVTLECFSCEEKALERERHWIEELQPQNNRCRGGNGGRCAPRSKYAVPNALKGKVTKAQWRKCVLEYEEEAAEIERIGSQKYVARWILANFDALSQFSKIDRSRVRAVAYG